MILANPKLDINLSIIEDNTRQIVQLAKSKGIDIFGVIKGVGGDIEIAKAMILGGVVGLGDSRLDNLKKLKRLKVPLMLLRIPMLSQAKRVVKIADISLNSQLEVIDRLDKEAASLNKVHKIILMIDLGDRREGVLPKDTLNYVDEIRTLKNIRLVGLGSNLACFRGVLPTEDKMLQLMELVKGAEGLLGRKLPIISGGNSSSLPLLLKEGYTPITNQLRVGETIILGRKVPSGDKFSFTKLDGIKLKAEVIEIKNKPVNSDKVNGDSNVNNSLDEEIRRRGILAIGSQDIEAKGLIPCNKGIIVEGASSDHLIVDLTNVQGVMVGDEVSFRLNYSSLLRAATSPYVKKFYYREDDRD
ncbi:alanine/ornithine racemase family PLP-dependent enzyme [Halonatronum saccharophilum]|uniref:alanine/ornithine racemase family PLP-dependent enzyme n=1 Tax=Halonatronum saccharophilum TaxID=150060 RepID=UPI000484955E|nr:alanine/ornithine racemase family PLP-dependent enzyme [Halonatronum saccharophilum]